MKKFVLSRFLGAMVSIVVLLIPNISQADFWSDAVGILTDPFKIGKGSSNILHAVERAAIHAERIQGKIDQDIEGYLDRIDSTVDDTRNWLSSERQKTFGEIRTVLSKISDMETKFIADTDELIKCSGVVTANTMKTQLSDALNDIGRRKPRFEAFGFVLGQVEIDEAKIPSPIKGFRETKSLYEKLISEVTEDDSPSIITDAYSEIQRLADLTRCHYKSDTNAFQDLYLIELEYNRKGRAWLGRTI